MGRDWVRNKEERGKERGEDEDEDEDEDVYIYWSHFCFIYLVFICLFGVVNFVFCKFFFFINFSFNQLLLLRLQASDNNRLVFLQYFESVKKIRREEERNLDPNNA